jgi:hypothetical protein
MPYVFFLDLSLLLWCKVIDDIEELADLLRSLALNHICHSFTANIAVTTNPLREDRDEGIRESNNVQQ